MKFKTKITKLLIVLIAGITLLFGLGQTLSLVKGHFTHIDDIGVADTILNWKLCDVLEAKKEKYSRLVIIDSVYESIKSHPQACEYLDHVYSFVSIPAHWTYAPFQFVFTRLSLASIDDINYEQIKFMGRLPSFIFYLLGFAGFLYILISKKYIDYNNVYLAGSVVLLLGLSLELRVMASQMHSYAIGLMSAVIIFSSVHSLVKNNTISLISIFLCAASLTIGISMQYQGLFLTAACCSALFFYDKRKFSVKFALRRSIALLSFIVILSPVYLFFLFKNIGRGSESYGKGINNEFVVTAPAFILRVENTFRLFLHETFVNIYSITSPVELSGIYAESFGAVICLLFLMGLIYLYKNARHDLNYYIYTSLICYVIINIFLVFLGLIPFSPTRHSLYHLFPIMLGLSFGLLYLSDKFAKIRFDLFVYLFVLALSIISLARFDNFERDRADPIDEELVSSYFGAGKVDIIFGDSVELKFLKSTSPIFFYTGENINCKRFSSVFGGKRSLRIGLYSKGSSSNIFEDAYFDRLFNRFLADCAVGIGKLELSKMENIYSFDALQEVEFVGRTKNTGNSIFLYRMNARIRF